MARSGIPLSKKRKAWAEKFKPDGVSRGSTLEYSAPAAISYTREVNKLINRMAADYAMEMRQLYTSESSKEYFVEDSVAMDASISSQSKKITDKLNKKWQKIFKEEGKDISKLMLAGIRLLAAVPAMVIAMLLLPIAIPFATADIFTGDWTHFHNLYGADGPVLATAIVQQPNRRTPAPDAASRPGARAAPSGTTHRGARCARKSPRSIPGVLRVPIRVA